MEKPKKYRMKYGTVFDEKGISVAINKIKLSLSVFNHIRINVNNK